MAPEEACSDSVRENGCSLREGRVYLHSQCGSLTQINGHNFLRLANPFAVVGKTICCACGKAVPIYEVAWADSRENIAAYRKRLRSAMPLRRRLFFAALGYFVGAAAGFLFGYAGVLLMIGPVGNHPWWRQESGLIGGVIGALSGSYVGAQLLTAPLMLFLWRHDYRTEQ
jgi:hypothetical protein